MSAATAYRDVGVQTADDGQLVNLLFDRLITGLDRAALVLDTESAPARLEEARLELQTCQRVLAELQRALDHSGGGHLAGQLNAIYDWARRQVIDASVHRDPTPARAVRNVLQPIRNAWASL